VEKRLGIGFLKGTTIALVIGLGVMLGLRWPTPSGSLLAYLLAMGVGGTAGVFGGRAPWKEGAWLEALLKMLFGVAVSAGLYYLAARYLPFPLPMPDGPAPWTSVPPFYLVPIGALYGALVELDYDGTQEKASSTASASRTAKERPKARAADIEDAEVVSSSKTKR
jgi:hypothetical protein